MVGCFSLLLLLVGHHCLTLVSWLGSTVVESVCVSGWSYTGLQRHKFHLYKIYFHNSDVYHTIKICIIKLKFELNFRISIQLDNILFYSAILLMYSKTQILNIFRGGESSIMFQPSFFSSSFFSTCINRILSPRHTPCKIFSCI